MRNHPLIYVLWLCGIAVGPVLGQVGEPTGFTITVNHGATVIAHKTVTIGPGGDIEDIKTNDGDPEGFTQIGTLNVAGNTSPIILKVVTGDDPMFRLLHMFINTPVSLSDIYSPGPFSLFDPTNSAPIEVVISNATFSGTTYVAPLLVNNNTFYTAFMRDEWGRFYELPQANAYNAHGNGIHDIQVPGERFLDSNPSLYTFASTDGAAGSWSWNMIPNPGPGTTIHDGTNGGQPSAGAGYVFELGLGVAFVGIPEPATLTLLLGGLMLAARRRR